MATGMVLTVLKVLRVARSGKARPGRCQWMTERHTNGREGQLAPELTACVAQSRFALFMESPLIYDLPEHASSLKRLKTR
jgi:hypothetical protein